MRHLNEYSVFDKVKIESDLIEQIKKAARSRFTKVEKTGEGSLKVTAWMPEHNTNFDYIEGDIEITILYSGDEYLVSWKMDFKKQAGTNAVFNPISHEEIYPEVVSFEGLLEGVKNIMNDFKNKYDIYNDRARDAYHSQMSEDDWEEESQYV
jgi:hypothetical protein